MNFRRRPVLAIAPAVAVVLTLSACTGGNPSSRRVAQDIIESVEGLTDAQRACMLDRLDGYTNEQLEQINAQNENVDFSVENPDVSQEWKDYEADLAECMETPTPVPGSTDVTGSTDATAPSEATASTDAAASSEPVGSTEPAAVTTSTDA